MDIEICASSLPRFAASVAASNALLTSLHIGWKGTFKLPKLKGGMTFPHLQNLTIEIGILTTQIMWPNMPQLRSLRIKRSVCATEVLIFALQISQVFRRWSESSS